MDVLLSELLAKAAGAPDRSVTRSSVTLTHSSTPSRRTAAADLTEDEESRSVELLDLRAAKYDKKLIELDRSDQGGEGQVGPPEPDGGRSQRGGREGDRVSRRGQRVRRHGRDRRAERLRSRLPELVLRRPVLHHVAVAAGVGPPGRSGASARDGGCIEVEVELVSGSKLGKEAEKQFREHFREGGEGLEEGPPRMPFPWSRRPDRQGRIQRRAGWRGVACPGHRRRCYGIRWWWWCRRVRHPDLHRAGLCSVPGVRARVR